MKKVLSGLLFFVLILNIPINIHAQQRFLSLDEAVEAAAKDIENTLAARTQVAILNFSAGSEEFSDYVIE
jgi:hypothetical protein